ncbi:uncharacterized protein [Dysidea avara]|uniref:uncharacterized protein n=1 Tax=Dysidea avara TaxID=196820 RepID=UPI003327DCB1
MYIAVSKKRERSNRDKSSRTDDRRASRIPKSTVKLGQAKTRAKVTWKEPVECTGHQTTFGSSRNKGYLESATTRSKSTCTATKRCLQKKKVPVNFDERRDEDDHELCVAEPCIIEFLSDEVGWIACDVCSRWYHKYCCHLAEGDNPRRFQCEKH